MGFSLKNIFNKDNVSNVASSAVSAATGNPLIGSVAKTAVGQGFDLLGFGQSVLPAVGAGLSYLQQNSLLDKQFAFQEYMSNTAHQREVKDLIAAGINPLYTATGGNGASTPMGSTGVQTDFANAFSSGVGSSMARRMQRAQIQAMDFENAARAQSVENGIKQNDLLQKQIDNYERELDARIQLMKDQGVAAIASGAASSAQASYNQEMALFQGLDRKERQELWQFLNDNPEIKKLYMTGYATGKVWNGK